MSKVYYDNDDLSPVLAGRYVTKVDGDTLTLDDGTVLEFEGNDGNGYYGSGFNITVTRKGVAS